MIISLPDEHLVSTCGGGSHPSLDGARLVCRSIGRFRRFLPHYPMALLRLLTNPRVMGQSPRTIIEAWEIFTGLRRDQRIVFAPDQERVDTVWRQFMTQPGVEPSSWTDTYLAALAQTHSYVLVTFDTGFKRWTDLN